MTQGEIHMFGTEIIRIPILPFGMVNAHLIRSEAACILVDAGSPAPNAGFPGCSPGTACRSATSS